MGLSSMPTPSEGMLTLLVNTALSVSILKEFLRSVLHLLRLRSPARPPSHAMESSFSPDDFAGELAEPTVADRFRTRSKPVRFSSAFCPRRRSTTSDRSIADCRVCLTRFEPESAVNRLPCGHLFHRVCLETWLDYHHATCPLCRSHVL